MNAYERVATAELFDLLAKRVSVAQSHLAAMHQQWQAYLASLAAHRAQLDAYPEHEPALRDIAVRALQRFDAEEAPVVDLPGWLAEMVSRKELPREPPSGELDFPPSTHEPSGG